jgi:DNA primase catalytic core
MNDRLNLEPLREAVNLVDVVTASGVQLKKSGKNYVGKCPLHDDSNPSFTVYPSRDGGLRCHCFVCDFDEDAIGFVMRRDRLEFGEAVKRLAEQYHIDLKSLNWTPEAIKEQKAQVERSEVLTRAARFYAARLWVDENHAAAAWALGRGFSEAHVRAVWWGYGKADDALLKAITRDAPEMLPLAREMGLIRADGKDFCANANGDEVSPEGWIIYPHMKNGKCVYLSARALNKAAKGGDKSRNIPGSRQVYRADGDLRFTAENAEGAEKKIVLRDDALVLVEGPADAESVRAWGWAAWAMCGAPIDDESSPQMMAALRKKMEHGTVYAAMSHDTAGKRFAEKIAQALGPLTRIVLWPRKDSEKKSDANQCLQAGYDADAVRELFDTSATYLDERIDDVGALRDVRKRADGIDEVAGLVAQLGETERKVYIGTVADAGLGVSRREFEKMVNERLKAGKNNSPIEVLGGQLAFFGEPLCNFVAKVESELIIDDGSNAPRIEYHVTGKLASGKTLPAIDVPAEEFDAMKWISKQWGARAFALVGNGKAHLLKRAILESSLAEMKTDRVHTFTGFYLVNGARGYLTASGALLAGGLDDTARVELPNNLAHYALPLPGTGEDLIAAVRWSWDFIGIAPAQVTVPLLAAMYGAPLTELKSLNTVLWIYGPTQSKKSTLGHLALSHYGRGFVQGRDYKAPKDWTSTAADLEATLFTCKDVPIIIDDYAPQFTSAQESRDIAKRAHYLIRSVGNRSSRGRRQANMEAKMQYLPRGLVIATAEQPLVGQSIVGRTVTIPVEYGAVDLDRLSAAQARHELYSMAMAGYVQWLINEWERVKTETVQLVDKTLVEMRGAFPNQDRLSDYYAALRVGLHWGLQYAQTVNAIDDACDREQAYLVDLLELLEGQSNRISEQSPVLKFFSAIEELVGAEKAVLQERVIRNAAGDEAIPEIPYNKELIGWRVPEERQVWLLAAPALTLVKEYWAGLDERFDTLLDALRREVWQHGYVAERDDRQLEPSKWINKKYGTRRVLVIDANKVHEKLNIDLLGENINA